MALVLSIKEFDGPIHIGDDITINLVSVSSNQAKLAFEAPEDVTIDRHTVWLRKQEEMQND